MDDALPSVGMTMRFLALCDQYGSQRNAVATIAEGRRAGVPGLPAGNDWCAWNAGQLKAAVTYLQRADRVTGRPAGWRRPRAAPAMASGRRPGLETAGVVRGAGS